MRRIQTIMAFLSLFAFTFQPLLADEQLFDFADESDISAALDQGTETDQLPEGTEEVEGSDMATVVLRENGELAGRFRLVWPTGKMEPADAAVSILRGEETVTETRTDDGGQFELVGLEPGDYIARATIAEGSKDFELAVIEHRSDASPSEMYFDATLTPLPNMVEGEVLENSCGGCGTCDACLASEVVATEVPIDECGMAMPSCMMGAPCGDPCGGFSGGGCCGGGGGAMWPLLGLAGLAGLAGLTNNNDNNNVVSPYQP